MNYFKVLKLKIQSYLPLIKTTTKKDLILNIPVVSFGRFTRSAASKIPSCTLYDCFQNFITPEQLEGKSWFCEGCKSKQNAEKSFLIYNLPNVLFDFFFLLFK